MTNEVYSKLIDNKEELPIPRWQLIVPFPSNVPVLSGLLGGPPSSPRVWWELQDSDGALLGSTWCWRSLGWRRWWLRNRPGRHSGTNISSWGELGTYCQMSLQFLDMTGVADGRSRPVQPCPRAPGWLASRPPRVLVRERRDEELSLITYCNIGCVVVEDSGDILIWEGTSRVTYQQAGLPHSSITHHNTLNNVIVFSSRGVFSSYLDRLHFA